MRTKSFPIRSSRNSLDLYPSLPERFEFGVSTTHDEIVPDTFDVGDVPHKKKRHCLRTSETGLNLDACIVCEVSDKCVSRCCGIDCPVSFHQECLDAEFGGSEDLENPFCPYCWFKIVALKSKALRDKAIDAEKTVFKYLDKEMESKDEVKESVPKCQEDTNLCGVEDGDQEHSVDSTDIVSDQELQGEKATYSSKEKQVQVDKDSDKPALTDQPEEWDKGKLEVGTGKSGEMKEDEVTEASEDEERVATENIQDDEDDETAEDQMKVNNKGAGEKGDVSPVLSMQESFSGKEHDQVQQNEKQRRRRRLILDATDSEFSSTKELNGEEDVTEQINSSANVAKSKTVRDISFFNKDQRRRLLWTSEEEEMLKVGVEKFAAEANKNMPWRKILEMGENVFHETRTPADLKDKWRNMIRLGKIMN